MSGVCAVVWSLSVLCQCLSPRLWSKFRISSGHPASTVLSQDGFASSGIPEVP